MPLFWMPAAAPCDISTSSSPSHDAPYSLPWHGCWPRHGLKTQHATRSLLKHSVPNTPMSLIEPGLGLKSADSVLRSSPWPISWQRRVDTCWRPPSLVKSLYWHGLPKTSMPPCSPCLQMGNCGQARRWHWPSAPANALCSEHWNRSEEHTSELQSLMRISYAVFCLKKKNNTNRHHAERA